MTLCLDSLRLVYADFAADYSLRVEAGSLCAVIGPSGGGKTTLLHAIAGFETPVSGTLSFEGADLLPLAPAQRPVAILFQDHNLFPHLSAFDNVALAIRTDLRLGDDQRSVVEAALADVELAGFGQRLPSQLSGGQRQRVALARALVSRKRLFLLDEPFAALDPGLRREMLAHVDELRRARGLTVLMTLHTPEDAIGHADLAAFVADGRIADVGPAEPMIRGGRSAALDAFLGLGRLKA